MSSTRGFCRRKGKPSTEYIERTRQGSNFVYSDARYTKAVVTVEKNTVHVNTPGALRDCCSVDRGSVIRLVLLAAVLSASGFQRIRLWH
jgi:hypothetical protein